MIVNGGFKNAQATREALTWCDGVMLGREAYHRPMVLAELEGLERIEDSVPVGVGPLPLLAGGADGVHRSNRARHRIEIVQVRQDRFLERNGDRESSHAHPSRRADEALEVFFLEGNVDRVSSETVEPAVVHAR